MMAKFGSNIICVDATHGTTMYDFLLITVLVMDEYGEGVPVAWALSNREDQTALAEFFKAIKARVGNLSPKILMSDCAEQFYTAWVGVFEGRPQKLLCTWHVDRAWRKKLNEVVPSQEERVTVYHHLRVLLEEMDVSRFNALLQQFLSFLDVSHPNFLDYFQREYVSHTEEWAYAYRVGAEINTNMFCESFHRVLKIVYLDSKQNRRVDRLLAVLLRFAKDKAFERIQKLEKGKSSHRMKEILRRHKTAVEMVSKGTVPHQVTENSWQVHSESSEQVYTVTRAKQECSCLLHCSDCHACIHMYTCSCADAHLQSTICKHSHLVQLFLHERSFDPCSTGQEGQSANDGKSDDDVVPASIATVSMQNETSDSAPDSIDYFSRILHSSDIQSLHQHKTVLKEKIYELQNLVDAAQNSDAICTAKQHVVTAINALKAMESHMHESSNTFPIRKRPASNAKSEKQLRFYSTKKKRVTQTRWAKPTAQEKQMCSEALEHAEARHCGICHKEDDTGPSDTVLWLQCSECNIWLHASCCQDDTESDEFVCENCMSIVS